MKNLFLLFLTAISYQSSFSQVKNNINVIIPNCGIESQWTSIKNNISEEYKAIYQVKDYHEWDNFIIENFNPKKSTIPKFLIKGLHTNSLSSTTGKWVNRMFFPGETMLLTIYNQEDKNDHSSFYIYASGTVVKKKNNKFPFIEKIENYELKVTNTTSNMSQTIMNIKNIPSWSAGGYEGGVFIYWIGDLNGDNKMDMLIGYSNHYAATETLLFLSNKNGKKLFNKYSVGGCSLD